MTMYANIYESREQAMHLYLQKVIRFATKFWLTLSKDINIMHNIFNFSCTVSFMAKYYDI